MLPRVVVFNAVSLDGRIDWFQPDQAQYYGLISTWQEDCTLAGSETILHAIEEIPPEDKSVFVPAKPDPDDTRPVLAIPDSRGRVRVWHAIKKFGFWKAYVALCSPTTPREYFDYLRIRHIDAIVAGDKRVDLRAALEELNARYGVKTVRVDSGGTLNGALLRAKLVDEVSVLIYPSLVGGESPKSMFRAPDLATEEGVIPLELFEMRKIEGGVVWLRYKVNKS
jgi:2,5-diamino-6-(ribosylamino)-4(3H)-pyrimidinone 5'-phosphate reductase